MTDGDPRNNLPHPAPFSLLLVRHGRTIANDKRIIQGHNDTPLTMEGQEHSKAKARKISTFPVSAVYCSDLPRARATLEIIRRENPSLPEPVYTEALREIDFGQYAGSVIEDLMDVILLHKKETWRKYPGGESGDDLMARVEDFVFQASIAHRGCHVLAVSHYGVIETVMRRFGGIGNDERFILEDKAVIRLKLLGDGKFETEYL